MRHLHYRTRRVLAICALTSIALHLIVLAAMPLGDAMPDASEARVLDVVLVHPEPPRPIDPAPASPPAPAAAPSKPDASAMARTTKPHPRAERSAAPRKEPEMRRTPERDTPLVEVPSAPPAQASTGLPAGVPPVAPSPSESSSAARGAGEPAPPRETVPATPPAFTASYLRNPAPGYPLIARRNGEQGTVMLRVLVTREGTPARVTVEQTSGSRHLDSAALETVKTWRFVPARRGDDAIEAWVLVPIVFRLEGTS